MLLRDFINSFKRQQPALENLKNKNNEAENEKKALSEKIEELKAEVDEAKVAGEEVAKSTDYLVERIRAIADDNTAKTAKLSCWGKEKRHRQLLRNFKVISGGFFRK